MAEVKTIMLYKGEERIIVNEADAAEWQKGGWKATRPGAKENQAQTGKAQGAKVDADPKAATGAAGADPKAQQ